MTLAHAGLADQDDVDVPADEISGGELFAGAALDRLVEGPIEGVQRLVFGKLRGGDAPLDPAVSPTGRLFAEEPIDGLLASRVPPVR